MWMHWKREREREKLKTRTRKKDKIQLNDSHTKQSNANKIFVDECVRPKCVPAIIFFPKKTGKMRVNKE